MMKETVKYIIYRIPFGPLLASLLKNMVDTITKKNTNDVKKLKQFKKKSEYIFDELLGNSRKGNVLFLGQGRVDFIIMESFVVKAFEKADYNPYILTDLGLLNRKTYSALNISHIKYFKKYCSAPSVQKTKKILQGIDTFDALLNLNYKNVQVGKYTASTLMRRFRGGNLSFEDLETVRAIEKHLARSLSYVDGAYRVLETIKPKAAVFVDRGYSPGGEFFDVFIKAGIICYTWNAGHRDNKLILKRYTQENQELHPCSLSKKSWEKLKRMEWDNEKKQTIHNELFDSYKSGQWYNEVGTQFNKKMQEPDSIIQALKIDSEKKTAIIFSHIFWDATFFWGEDLFLDYEDWFVQTVLAACQNDNLNWIIKVHPANIIKDRRDGVVGDTAEVKAIREKIGSLPKHIKFLPADTHLSTFSLMEMMDYCLTVRGTIGIEASMLGKRVITAGTGRYDNMGFTMDFSSTGEYLRCLSEIEQIPSQSKKITELAEKYAYGVFVARPVSLQSLIIEYQKDEHASLKTHWAIDNFQQLSRAQDLLSVSEWIKSGEEDYLLI